MNCNRSHLYRRIEDQCLPWSVLYSRARSFRAGQCSIYYSFQFATPSGVSFPRVWNKYNTPVQFYLYSTLYFGVFRQTSQEIRSQNVRKCSKTHKIQRTSCQVLFRASRTLPLKTDIQVVWCYPLLITPHFNNRYARGGVKHWKLGSRFVNYSRFNLISTDCNSS